MQSGSINIINRNGKSEPLDCNKVLKRIERLVNMEPKLRISGDVVVTKTISFLVDNIPSWDIDNVSAAIAANMITNHIDYEILATRIMISNIHKNTNDCYYKTILNIQNNLDNILSAKLVLFVNNYKTEVNNAFVYKNDYTFKYFGIHVLLRAYLLRSRTEKHIIYERPQHLYMRVAIGLHLDKIDDKGFVSNQTVLSEIFDLYKTISEGYYSHATPTLFNAGTELSGLSSCFLLEVGDSVDGIYGTLNKGAHISKYSGGIGIHVSQVRASGSKISTTGGVSEGLVKMLKVYNCMANHMSQGGGRRKGSIAVYFELWHADVMEVLDCILPLSTGDESKMCRDLFFAAWIDDLFFKRLELAVRDRSTVYMWSLFCPNIAKNLTDKYGIEFEELYTQYENEKLYFKQVNILTIWDKILQVIEEAGRLYMMSKDSVNKKCNQSNLGTIKSSNLCVHGDTLILTDSGYRPIKQLANKTVNVWNGKQFAPAPVRQTNVNQSLLKIKTSDGCELKCTEYHKFYVYDSFRNIVVIKNAMHLKKDDKLIPCEFPVIDGNDANNFIDAYTHGFYCGEGGIDYQYFKHEEKIKCIDIDNSKIKHVNKLNCIKFSVFCSTSKTTRLIVRRNIQKRFSVPMYASLSNKLEWLAGLIDASGTIVEEFDEPNKLSIAVNNKKFLMNVKLLCNTLGLNPEVVNDIKYYTSNFKLNFNSYETHILYHKLFIPSNLVFTDPVYPDILDLTHTINFIKIKSIKPIEGLHDTYCFNEITEHKGIFNGMITGNCSEITIFTDEKNVGVCNLASVCLNKFVKLDESSNVYYDYDHLYKIAYKVALNVNKVIDNNKYPITEGKYSDSRNRPIGIGVQGLADVFMMFKTSFVSDLAKEINKKIFETIYFATLNASSDLALKYGSYETYTGSFTEKGLLQFDLWKTTPSFEKWDWDALKSKIKKQGLRNSLLISLMPTASSASIMGNSENFEPNTENIYMRKVLSGDFQIVNKYLINDLIKLNLWSDEMKQLIIANRGSIQNISVIPANLKDIYKTAYEYPCKDLIDMDADRAPYVCQSMSSNRFIKDFDKVKMTKMYIYAWKKGLKTLSYYVRTKPAANAVQFTIDNKIIKRVKREQVQVKEEREEEECTMCSA